MPGGQKARLGSGVITAEKIQAPGCSTIGLLQFDHPQFAVDCQPIEAAQRFIVLAQRFFGAPAVDQVGGLTRQNVQETQLPFRGLVGRAPVRRNNADQFAAAGEQGAARALSILAAETDTTLALLGVTSTADLGEQHLWRGPCHKERSSG